MQLLTSRKAVRTPITMLRMGPVQSACRGAGQPALQSYLDGELWSANVETLDSSDNRYSSPTTREVFQLPGGRTVALGLVARDRIMGSMLARVEEYVDAIELVHLRRSVHAL
jgi:hypothetical protein